MDSIQTMDSQDNIINLSTDKLDDLAQSIRGQVYTPGNSDYECSRTLWNAMIDRKPAFIVSCTGTSDVIEAVKFAKSHNLLISVRGAGHNIAGRALGDKVMLIDLQNLKDVTVDPDSKTVTVRPGATLGDLDHETQLHGLALPVGINSTTGIAGLTLGGGFGWLSRKYGMTIDSLISAEVVTTNGDCIVCDDTNYSDLFWAIKGGGGNFGIVTSFKFRLHTVGPEILSGPVIFDLKEAKAVLNHYRQFCAGSPEDFTVWSVLRKAPPFPFIDEKYHGQPVIIMACFFIGNDEKDAKPFIEQVRKFGSPIGDGFGPHQYKQFQATFDPLLTPGARNYWKSHNFKNIPDALIDLLVEYAFKLPSDESEIFMAQMGGATNRIDSDYTAYPHRDVDFIMNVHTRWQNPDRDQACVEWARNFYQDTKPYATGGVYVNFVSEGDESIDDAYGHNISKLKRIKNKYDPDNLLRANLNILPQ